MILIRDNDTPAQPHLFQAMEAAGYIFDRRESDSEHLRFYDTDTQNIIHMNSLNETRQWLEGVVFDDPIISDKVEGILYPERLQTSPRLQEKKTSIRQQLQQAQQKVKAQAPRQRKTEPELS